ncbi:hypothetical protein E4U59_000478 [Claviceps monticola]|nr:hypothetical protein E4U59_000478 [Claviceps monticola]
MVKFPSVVIAILAAINPVVQAGNCVPGLNYCGHTLEDHGWKGRGLERQKLYHCKSKDKVTPLEYCRYGCRDRGAGNTDYCVVG